jgi:choline kinase
MGISEFYEASFQEMINEGVILKAVDVSAFPAMEIDTPEDFERAGRLKVDE